MQTIHAGYSPDVRIHLEIGENKIRLSDVLYDTATLYEKAEVPPQTRAMLVFSIGGKEDREEVILENGISREDSLISFSYSEPKPRLNR
jgi:hypothetical protein